jgi:hypothetical protein
MEPKERRCPAMPLLQVCALGRSKGGKAMQKITTTFYVDTCAGTYGVTKEQIDRICSMKSDIEIDAFVLGVSVNDLVKWQAWRDIQAEPWRCCGITKRGERCQLAGQDYEEYAYELDKYLDYVKIYGKNPQIFCKVHSK